MLTFALYIAVGAGAGLSAGLFGIGGGLVIVPVLVLCFAALGFSAEVLTQMAVGTSLATIVVTSISSVRAHHALGNVRWGLFALLTPGIALGVWLGANTAALMPGSVLQLVFGAFVMVMAAQMGLGLKPSPSRELPGGAALSLVGAAIGYISALFGIGGGSISVPFFSWCNVRMQQAVATSAACGLPIAVVGALSNMAVGWQHPLLPAYSLGYVYLPAFAGIVISSALFARIGAQWAQRLPSAQLKRYFAVLLFLVGVQFIARNL